MVKGFEMIILIIFLLPLYLYAQPFDFQFQPEGFPVTIDGWQPYCPWAGGYSETAPDFCDIDADGDLDLFVGEYFGWVSYFKNIGDSFTPNFNLIDRQYDSLFTVQDWGRSNPDFYDLDNDGDYDALIGSGRVTYVENIGISLNPCFLSNRDTLFDITGNWVFGTHVSIVDIDWDNDGDLICGEYQGHLQFYRNVGMPDSFAFYLEDNYWLGIDVGGYADPTLIDIDGDNDYDLFIGDAVGNIHYYRNDGDSLQWDYTLVSSSFLNIDVGDDASPEFGDVDGDGDYDMLVGREATTSNKRGDIYYYENIGSTWEPQFRFVTKNYLTIDLSYNTLIPQLVDINGDGLLDFFGGTARVLYYFENTGVAASPGFNLVDDNFAGINIQEMHPCFVDLDADGDYDLLCGESAIPGPSAISLYINQGTVQQPNMVLYNENYITNSEFFVNIQPCCADIDGDGDQDLFITDDHGFVYYYQNNGDSTMPRFDYITDTWQGMYFPGASGGGWRMLSFGDLDNDGDLDLLMQNVLGGIEIPNIRYYRNEGCVFNPLMVFQTNTFLPGYSFYDGSPFLCDIDDDGDLDLFVGNSNGGVMFYRNFNNPYQAQLTVSISGSNVILSWENVANAIEYRIFYQDIPYFTPSGLPQAVVLPPDTVWTDVGAGNLGQRFYRVVVSY